MYDGEGSKETRAGGAGEESACLLPATKPSITVNLNLYTSATIFIHVHVCMQRCKKLYPRVRAVKRLEQAKSRKATHIKGRRIESRSACKTRVLFGNCVDTKQSLDARCCARGTLRCHNHRNTTTKSTNGWTNKTRYMHGHHQLYKSILYKSMYELLPFD